MLKNLCWMNKENMSKKTDSKKSWRNASSFLTIQLPLKKTYLPFEGRVFDKPELEGISALILIVGFHSASPISPSIKPFMCRLISDGLL